MDHGANPTAVHDHPAPSTHEGHAHEDHAGHAARGTAGTATTSPCSGGGSGSACC